MASWIEQREQLRSRLLSDRQVKEENQRLRAEKVRAESPKAWKSLSVEILSQVATHNRIIASAPQAQILECSEENYIQLTGRVTEMLPGFCISSPAPIILHIQFIPHNCVVSFAIPDRNIQNSLYFDLTPSGDIGLYRGPHRITTEKGAEIILCAFLDITNPSPSAQAT